MLRSSPLLRMVSVVVLWTLVAAACTEENQQEFEPESEGGDGGSADLDDPDDVGAVRWLEAGEPGTAWRLDAEDSELAEPMSVDPVEPPPLEELPDGTASVGEGVAVEFAGESEGRYSIVLEMPQRPADDARPAALVQNDDGSYEIVYGVWDPDLETYTVTVSVLEARAGAGFGALSVGKSFIRPSIELCVSKWCADSESLVIVAVWLNHNLNPETIGSYVRDQIWPNLSSSVSDQLLEPLIDTAEKLISLIPLLGEVPELLDWLFDYFLGTTDPIVCDEHRRDWYEPPAWASIEKAGDYAHTCLQGSNGGTDKIAGKKLAVVMFKSNRSRHLFGDVPSSVETVNAEGQDESTRCKLGEWGRHDAYLFTPYLRDDPQPRQPNVREASCAARGNGHAHVLLAGGRQYELVFKQPKTTRAHNIVIRPTIITIQLDLLEFLISYAGYSILDLDNELSLSSDVALLQALDACEQVLINNLTDDDKIEDKIELADELADGIRGLEPGQDDIFQVLQSQEHAQARSCALDRLRETDLDSLIDKLEGSPENRRKQRKVLSGISSVLRSSRKLVTKALSVVDKLSSARYLIGLLVDGAKETGGRGPGRPAILTLVGSTAPGDYDTDDDGLIEIDSIDKLNAMRWDADGDGDVDQSGNDGQYALAFPGASAGMGCEGGCLGYELVADLDFGAHSAGTDGQSWEPIPLLSGTFEGNGHTISNLAIEETGTGCTSCGLFAAIAGSGAVRGLELDVEVVVRVGRSSNVGGLAGTSAGTVVDSHVSGTVEFQGSGTFGCGARLSVGGLVGENTGSVTRSSSRVTTTVVDKAVVDQSVLGEGCGDDDWPPRLAGGGLVGSNGGEIARSRSAGWITVSAEKGEVWLSIGGLVGDNLRLGTFGSSSTGSVSGSFSTAPLTSETNGVFGGLVGSNGGRIDGSSAAGNITSRGGAIDGRALDSARGATVGSAVGGLAGVSIGSVDSSYATGDVESRGWTAIGGLVGISLSDTSPNHAQGAGRISSTYSAGDVAVHEPCDRSASSAAGGLVGRNGIGPAFMGPIVAAAPADTFVDDADRILQELLQLAQTQTNQASVKGSFSTGEVASSCSSDDVGGLVGRSVEGSIEASYWDTALSGIESNSDDRYGRGLSSSELKKPTRSAGIFGAWPAGHWDFGTSEEYPVLKFAAPGIAEQKNRTAPHPTGAII